jgi:hypothetical protein
LKALRTQPVASSIEQRIERAALQGAGLDRLGGVERDFERLDRRRA